MTTRQIRSAAFGRTLLTVAAAALLIVGPTLNTATEDGGFGMAAAARGGGGGARGGGGGARGGGGGARGGGGGGYSRPSSVDRAPRQASASRGSIGGANRDFASSSRPAGLGGGSQARPQVQSRPQVQDRPASRPEVKRPEGGSKVAQARPADATRRSTSQARTQDRAELSKKMQTHERPKAGTRGETGRLAGAAGAGAAAGIGAGALGGGGERERPGAGDRAPGDRQGDRQADRGQRQDDRTAQRGDRQGERGQRQDDRAGQRGDRQGERGQRQEDRQGDRGQRQDDRTAQRDERRQDTQQNRDERRQNVQERRQEYSDNRQEIRNDRQDRMNEWRNDRQDFLEDRREDRMDFAEEWREDRMDLWEDIYDDHHFWGDWDDDWWDDDDNGWVWGLVGGVVGYAIGAAVNSPPEGYVTVPYAGTNYQYYGGAFYQPVPAGTPVATTGVATTADTSAGGVTYVTVPAPVGATVEAPPLDCTIVYGPDPADPGYCYFGGAFFLYDEKTDKYVVAEPPVGTEVPYLPEGYTVEKVGDREFYKLGPTYYRHYIAGDDEVYVVAKA